MSSFSSVLLDPPVMHSVSFHVHMRIAFVCRIGFVCIFAFLLSIPLWVHAHAVISEVMWMGTDVSTQDEWLEITGIDADTDLSGWRLTSMNTSGNEVTLVQFATGTTLPVDASWVIARYPAAQSRLLAEPQKTTSTMTLPNSKLLLRLRSAQGDIADQADDGAGEPLAGANPSGGAKASMERVSLHGSGAVKASWKTSSATFGWDEGSPIYGSPGFAMISSSSSSNSSSSPIDDQPSINCTNSEHIFVSELMPDPEGTDTDHEWIELQNPTSDPWTLNHWTVEMDGSSRKTLPDMTIEPLSVLLVPTQGIGLNLANAGGTLILRDAGERECDRVTYPNLPTGIAFGRGADDGQWKPQCYPTPGQPNLNPAWNPDIGIESGSTIGMGKTKLNILLTTVEGFTGTPQCSVDFGDGQKTQSCDPGWHTYGAPGTFTLTMNATNACSTTVSRTLNIQVFSKSSSASSNALKSVSATLIASTGEVPLIISGALPNPTGDDKGHEWVEVLNTSSETVTARGLVFVSGSKKGTALAEEVFQPRERKRYVVSLLGLKLGNEDSGIELQTNAGETLSVLHWGKAQEAAVYRYSSFATALGARVLRVIDGDTFEVTVDGDDERKEDLRLLGVDAPETVHPTKGIQPFGIEASNYTKALLENKKVELQFDSQERDIYGRALAYVYVLPAHESVQEMMIREGLVKVDEQHLYTKKDTYLALQDEAKAREVGMWAKISTKKKSSSSASSKSSKSSSKKSVSVRSIQTVATADPYDSKPVYENVFSSEQGNEQVSSGSPDDQLYASLLQDQPEIAESLHPQGTSGISTGLVLGVLLVNVVTLFGALAGGFFVAQRLQINSSKMHS